MLTSLVSELSTPKHWPSKTYQSAMSILKMVQNKKIKKTRLYRFYMLILNNVFWIIKK